MFHSWFDLIVYGWEAFANLLHRVIVDYLLIFIHKKRNNKETQKKTGYDDANNKSLAYWHNSLKGNVNFDFVCVCC